MDRDRSTLWFSITGVALPLAAIAVAVSGALRDKHPRLADQLLLATGVLAAVGIACAVVGIVARVRHPRIKFRTHAEDQGPEARLSLFRKDGEFIHDSRCRITRRRWHRTVRHARPEHDPLGSVRPTFTYSADFESLLIDGVLGKGRHAVVWETRLRNRKTGLMEWRRVARGRFRVTDELRAAAERLRERGTWTAGSETRAGGARLSLTRQESPIGMVKCEVRRRLEDGSRGDAYVCDGDGEGAGEVALEFPAEFLRQLDRRTPGWTPAGEAGDPGNYEVLWKVVWFVSSGTFAADHEVTASDFRREGKVAQHRFQITA